MVFHTKFINQRLCNGLTARVAGPYLLLEKITHMYGLDKLLKRCFSEKWKFMLSLVYFLAHKGMPLSRAEAWSNSCLHPYRPC